MSCPYCHDLDHSSLGKCPRWTGKMDRLALQYGGTRTARYHQQAQNAALLPAGELEAMMAAYRACPNCLVVQDSVSLCKEHHP